MRSGLAVALGLALSALLAVATVAAQLALLQPPPPAAESVVRGSISVGGIIHVYVNGQLRYKEQMSSFTDNIVSILYALLTGSQTATVVDINGSVRVVNVTVALGKEAVERFYLPLTDCIIDYTYHGYPGAVLWLRGPGLNINITEIPPPKLGESGTAEYPEWPTDIDITPIIKAWCIFLVCNYEYVPDVLTRNATHDGFAVYTQPFQVLQSTPGPVKLTYARLMHDKDGRPIYVPMVEETIPLTLNAGDWVEVHITVYVAGQPNGGGSRFFTLFVYEMLSPEADQPVVYLNQLMSSGYYLLYVPSLHDTYCGAPSTFLSVVPGYKPEITVTTAPWPYNRSSAAYAYPFYYYYASAPIYKAPLQVERSGKTITLRGVFTNVGGMNVTGSAVLLYHATMSCTDSGPVLTGAEPIPWFSVREDVSVPPGKALLAEVVITFK